MLDRTTHLSYYYDTAKRSATNRECNMTKQVEAYNVSRNIGNKTVNVLVTVKRTSTKIDGVRKTVYQLVRHTWGYDTMFVPTRVMVRKALEII